MSGSILDRSNGITTSYHEEDGKTIIKRETDLTDLIEANKRRYNDVTKSDRMGDFVMVGRVDAVVLDRWCKEDGINYLAPENKGKLLKKLEHPDNRFFKTHPGKFA
jgi:hypothetical protein